MQVDSHIIIFTLNGASQGTYHAVPHVYGVILFKQYHISILFIKLMQDMINYKVVNRSQSVCESSYIDTLALNKFINISMFS